MKRRILALIGAWVCLSIVYMAGFMLFGPLFADEALVAPPLVPFFFGFALSNTLFVLFFAWVSEQMDHVLKAAITVAVSQLLLVNVNYVLTGGRTVVAGIASSVVLLVAWPLVAVVYQSLLGPRAL